MNLQEKKDQFYVTGLLHDIGRVAQYETGEHHSEAGMRIAKQLLSDIGYPSEWMSETLQIVGVHHGREEENAETGVMEYYIRRADHLSRNCFYVRRQIPVNGVTRNAIRPLSGKIKLKK